MKFLLILFVLLIPLNSWGEPASIPRISYLDGDVMLSTRENNEWVPAAINTPLYEGDTLLSAQNGRVEMQLSNGSRVRLDNSSQIEILNLDNSYIQLHLSQGRLFVRTSGSKEQNLQIDADDTTVLPFANSRLRVDMKPNSTEEVSIFKGGGYVEGAGSRTKVRAGEQIVLEDQHSELLPLEQADAWEKWNLQRDQRIKRNFSGEEYLPKELRQYAGDLEGNGHWIRDDEYGYVWQPTISDPDWTPYRVGRWVWLRGDYVWVSYEPWGWAPHHYGRWITYPGRGWYWVPPAAGELFWSPGNVGWLSFGVSIGWVPLAPREIYYGYGNYGRHSVNVATINIKTVDINHNYRNLGHDRRGVILIHRDDFIKGKSVVHPVASSIVLSKKSFLPGRPLIKPERETRMPILKKTGSFQYPSMQIKTSETQNRFPRISVQERSRIQQNESNQLQNRERQIIKNNSDRHEMERGFEKSDKRRSEQQIPEQTKKRTIMRAEQTPTNVSTVLPSLGYQRSQTGQQLKGERKVWRVKTKESDIEANQNRKENKKEQRENRQEQIKNEKESGGRRR